MPVPVWSVDPRTGKPREQVAVEATAAEVDAAVTAAAAALPALADRAARARLLRTAADLLDGAADRLVSTADAETALGAPRLTGELARTTFQLRFFADLVDEGAFLDVRIDHADPHAVPAPRPDLRRYKVPIGVVAVYSASNFPLAFSVPGGDTASALAAGCSVVVKAHPDHPATSELCAALLRRAAAEAGLPEAVVSLVHGFRAGTDLVAHPLVAAAGFTGSVAGGRALHDAAAARPRPIPFHGELGSLNPVVVTAAAAAERAEEIGTGLAASFTLGNGQFCTKPGLVLVPAGDAGDRLVAALAGAVAEAPAGVLLDVRMRERFLAGVRERAALPEVTAPVAPGPGGTDGAPLTVRPGFLTVPAARLAAEGPHDLLTEECFGPVTVVARYQDGPAGTAEVAAVLARLAGNLTATAHLSRAEAAGTGSAAELLARLTPLAGRVLVNGWPTGVAVAPAQHHGGPYPATTSTSTSVGATAVERWLRPVVHQDTPPALLPPELRDDNPSALPRRVDGAFEQAPARTAPPATSS
ncbi:MULTISPECIES: aldehyde dehydrogenase family protein [Streptomycetaceae]|uniref:2,5-dioxovalerate dehydrogenase n=1 Tax=Streptantibioticus cattleyicolor (strain ATCC 35852 / DSM 46488 / JCM 4925 / NBRC 14057 / NRRL 8057) TaxID=1003195 RepID=F8JYW3_STREN|nr:aldehyde dehydrogenase family protein [Streptantibioticus cattleyicolor]AEW93435.1 aldehyde dehydrogenase [Streptantibioticus cattleyicolor NRRL 8057 = DSM 46488]MYS58147.1 aldehyde dehydrogenase family protein [Streptomyces sp. SID5468]CCB73789.1 NADP-dependent fatty aldehyde dehydrogenase [Streptantibioticus cattleyicolor NRRL 8057 = DSM 46488]